MGLGPSSKEARQKAAAQQPCPPQGKARSRRFSSFHLKLIFISFPLAKEKEQKPAMGTREEGREQARGHGGDKVHVGTDPHGAPHPAPGWKRSQMRAAKTSPAKPPRSL